MFRNIGYNFLGMALPLVAAAFCIPILIRGLGTEAFGVLTIVWMLIGYFSVFDLGLGRSLTQSVARLIGAQQFSLVGPTVALAQKLMLWLGICGAGLVILLAPVITESLLNVSPNLVETTRNSLYILGCTIPLVIQSTGAKGVLEALGRFGLSSAIRAPIGAWTFAGPLVAMQFSQRLDAVVASLVAGRVVNYLCFRYALLQTLRQFGYSTKGPVPPWRPLVTFGGWLTISNFISPVMVYMDRFFISALLGAAVVAFYTTPYEAVFKIGVIPEAVFGVLFPLLTVSLAARTGAYDRLLRLGNGLVLALVFPVVVSVVAVAPELLHLWLGADFASKSSRIMQVLALGLFINSFSKNVLNLVQAAGRPDISAKIHLIELPIYVACLWWALKVHGVAGAAYAWLFRMMLDFSFLGAACTRLNKDFVRPLAQTALYATVFGLVLFGIMSLESFERRVFAGAAAMLCATVTGFSLLWRLRSQLVQEHNKPNLVGDSVC